jgi:outer membrane protein assembly factor BamB
MIHSDDGKVTAFEPGTGKTRWVLDLGLNGEISQRNQSDTPGLLRAAPGGLLIAEDDSVVCIDPVTEVTRWREKSVPSLLACTPDAVFVRGSDQVQRIGPAS